ncbi:MAG TPA: hypothetical protein VIG68_06625 [Lysobacter sp.]
MTDADAVAWHGSGRGSGGEFAARVSARVGIALRRAGHRPVIDTGPERACRTPVVTAARA